MIKHCVGAIIYNEEGKIFLMTSSKWEGYLVPGGRIENGESEVDALKREIKEELGIKITNIKKISEKIKPPSKDFKKDETLSFHFYDYFAKAISTNIKPNHEIINWGWYTITQALELPLMDTTRNFVEVFKRYVDSGLIKFD